MYSFRNDYSEGAHPRVLQALVDTNLTQTCGYGVDPICDEARALIRTLCAAPDAAVHFLVGGTQTNLTVITALLASYEAVIAAHPGHVNCHETGAIEATGHKVCTAYSPDGKVTPEMVESVLAIHADGEEHMVAPKLVYISDTTEIGTVYTKAELTALRQCSRSAAVSGRCAAWLRPHLSGKRFDAVRPCRPDGRIHHRRHEKRRAVRRGGHHDRPL